MRSQEAIERFGIKHADLASLLPAIALPALGQFLGKRLHGDVGQLIGGITGGIGGQLLRESLSPNPANPPPSNLPYTIDPTTEDIPPWALQSAQALMPQMKQADHKTESVGDIIWPELGGPIVPAVQGYRHSGLRGAGKHVLGSSAGLAGGALAGHGMGLLLNHLLNHGQNINVPGINMNLSTILGGLGATVGGVKGLQWARK